MKKILIVLFSCCFAQFMTGQTTHHQSTSYEDAVSQGWSLRNSSLSDAYLRWENISSSDFVIPDEYAKATYPNCKTALGSVRWKDCLKLMYINNQKDMIPGDKLLGLDGRVYYGQSNKLSSLGVCSNLKSIQGRFRPSDWTPDCGPEPPGGEVTDEEFDQLKDLLDPIRADILGIKGDIRRLEDKIDSRPSTKDSVFIFNRDSSFIFSSDSVFVIQKDSVDMFEDCGWTFNPYVGMSTFYRLSPSDDPWLKDLTFVPEVGLTIEKCSWWRINPRLRLWPTSSQKAVIIDADCEDCLEFATPEQLEEMELRGNSYLDLSIGGGIEFKPFENSSSDIVSNIFVSGNIYSPNLLDLNGDRPDMNGFGAEIGFDNDQVRLSAGLDRTWSKRMLASLHARLYLDNLFTKRGKQKKSKKSKNKSKKEKKNESNKSLL